MGKAKILIVDDHVETRLLLRARLQANDFEAVFAADSLQALSSAQRERPAAIILDLNMPGGNGFTVMQRLQALPPLACIPIIIVSSEDPQVAEARALEAGAVAFLQKPVDQGQLIATLRKALGEPSEA